MEERVKKLEARVKKLQAWCDNIATMASDNEARIWELEERGKEGLVRGEEELRLEAKHHTRMGKHLLHLADLMQRIKNESGEEVKDESSSLRKGID